LSCDREISAANVRLSAPTGALATIRGHKKIQRLRPTGYLTELPVEHKVVRSLPRSRGCGALVFADESAEGKDNAFIDEEARSLPDPT